MIKIDRLLNIACGVAFAVAVVGCNDSSTEDGAWSYGEGEGAVALNFDMSDDESIELYAQSIVLSNSVLKVYSSSSTTSTDDDYLVRRYEPATEAPDYLYLMAGGYRATLLGGDDTAATFDSDYLTYYGESEAFEIEALLNSEVTINCPMKNTYIEVLYDNTVVEQIEDYRVKVWVEGASPAIELEYTTSDVGYFIVPAGSNLTWSFEGTKISNQSSVTANGEITTPAAGEGYRLSFAYSNYLTVAPSSITVDDTTEDFDDSFDFVVQPQITSDGSFDVTQFQSSEGEYSFNISSLNDLGSISVSVNGVTVWPFKNEVAQSVSGASYSVTSATAGVLTIGADLLNDIDKCGESSVTIRATDVKSSYKELSMPIITAGVTSITNVDLWSNTATINALSMASEGADVVLRYRVKGDEDWIECSAVTKSGYSYSATTPTVWTSGTNAKGNSVYQLLNGVESSSDYEAQLVVDGVQYGVKSFETEDVEDQDIPSASLDNSGMSCYGTGNSGSSTWGSGNNTYATDLCNYDTTLNCAKMASKSAGIGSMNIFAAGNLFFGQFQFNQATFIIGSDGTVRFGQAFDWTARPRAIKLKYAATVGAVDMVEYDCDVDTGDTDPARVYVAVVDWTSRRSVTAGYDAPDGTWDPVADMTLSGCGDIIGYASEFITSSTTTTELHDLEIPFYFYDTVTKPSEDYTLVISCASSAYGDYLTGCTSNKLWVKDFEFVY